MQDRRIFLGYTISGHRLKLNILSVLNHFLKQMVKEKMFLALHNAVFALTLFFKGGWGKIYIHSPTKKWN